MKNGIEYIEISLELLDEVFQNNFDNFRQHLNDNHIKGLILHRKTVGRNLRLLGEALKGTAVTGIDLAWNDIGPIGAKDLVEGLKDTAVTDIDLSWNGIGPISAKSLGNTLKGTALSHVNLTANGISANGAKALGETLKDTAVTHVNLTFNQINDEGAKIFVNALRGTEVAYVDLRCNNIGEQGVIDIIAAIPYTNLTQIITDSKISNQLKQQLEQALAANKLRLNLEAYLAAEAILENNQDALYKPNSAQAFVPTEVIGLLLQHFPIVRAEIIDSRDTLINQFINMASKKVSRH